MTGPTSDQPVMLPMCRHSSQGAARFRYPDGMPEPAPTSIPTLTSEPLSTVLNWLRAELAACGEARLNVPDPDAGQRLGLYPGEPGPAGIHRPYLTWLDLADLLDTYFLTPVRLTPTRLTPLQEGEPRDEGYVQLHFRRRPIATRDRSAERYAAGSEFGRVNKLEDPHFLHDLSEALTRAALPPTARVLSLGVGSGRELDLLEQVYPGQAFKVLGLDLDASALERAQTRHPGAVFWQQDVMKPELVERCLAGGDEAAQGESAQGESAQGSSRQWASAQGRFDLIMALSLFQSPGINQADLLWTLRTRLLAPSGTLILGFPNARYRGNELSYGARMLNFTRPDLSLLVKDLAAARKQLQAHGFKVYVTGKYEVLVTGVRQHSNPPDSNPSV
jgi:SAM-dependent methyltransferase